jgi:hypothetical protein
MVNDNLAQGARAAHDWGLASWLGGSMSVARSAYVAEPNDASMIRRPVSRATGGAGARPASNALTCSTPGSAASAG